jgi:protoheme IX farnesyltransferase
MSKIKAYYSLTKPGVLYGNAITAAAGYLLASRGMIDWWLFLALCVGSTLVIASACVLNNYLDQDIDKVMARTKKRAIVSGKVSGRNALIFSIVLGIVGLAILVAYTNPIVVAIGVVGFVDYVVLYGMLSKRLSVHGTLVGSISGAMPILAGYCAATGAVDLGAFIVFAILFLWQMPEFYSIAIYRRKEYQKAGVPVISVMNGVENTKHQIIAYTVMFVVASVLLAILGYAGSVYLVVMSALGGYWIGLALQGLKTKNADEWARRMFHFSLVILLAFCGLISVDAWLP